MTFGMIVLNGEPFLAYNLRALYPFAHQIIVVEGASPSAARAATADGHSVDGTLERLGKFVAQEDPDHKITVVVAEDDGHPNGFWPGEKDEQSSAYARRATGDWLWHADVDEFYHESDIRRVLQMLAADPAITAVTFPEIPFWGSFDVRCDGILLRMEYSRVHRLFKWGPGYHMVTHRPPTVTNAEGRDLRSLHWIDAQHMEQMGIYLYHYTQLLPSQVSAKMAYYDRLINDTNRRRRIKNVDRWLQESFYTLHNPYRVHTVNTWPSWLEEFTGPHPTQIERLQADIASGAIHVSLRDMSDARRLLRSRRYQAGICVLKLWANYVVQSDRACRDLVRRRIGFRQFCVRLCNIALGRQRVF